MVAKGARGEKKATAVTKENLTIKLKKLCLRSIQVLFSAEDRFKMNANVFIMWELLKISFSAYLKGKTCFVTIRREIISGA